MPMTALEAAASLNGSQYPIREDTPEMREFFQSMREARLIAVYGHSDDIMMMHGTILDEFYAETWINANGETSDEPLEGPAASVEPLWCAEEGISWTYRTTIPHETFLVMENADTYCRGIVFSLDNLTVNDGDKVEAAPQHMRDMIQAARARAGSMPSCEAVKLHPDDWNAVVAAAEKLAFEHERLKRSLTSDQ